MSPLAQWSQVLWPRDGDWLSALPTHAQRNGPVQLPVTARLCSAPSRNTTQAPGISGQPRDPGQALSQLPESPHHLHRGVMAQQNRRVCPPSGRANPGWRAGIGQWPVTWTVRSSQVERRGPLDGPQPRLPTHAAQPGSLWPGLRNHRPPLVFLQDAGSLLLRRSAKIFARAAGFLHSSCWPWRFISCLSCSFSVSFSFVESAICRHHTFIVC